MEKERHIQQECEALSSAVYKELKAANNHISSRSFPRWASDKMAAPADTLIAALWNPEAEDPG